MATNCNGVDDVSIIHALLRWALDLLAPGTGKRRATPFPARPTTATNRSGAHGPHSPAPASRLPGHRSPYGRDVPLDGHATALVRPYLATHERQRAQHRRRLTLVLAADFGIDLDRHLVGAGGSPA
jgi:hypothetical protein